MNYSCQEEREHDMNCQWQAEAEALAEQEEIEWVYGDDDIFDEYWDLIDDDWLSCCWTHITDTWLCVECVEHCE